LLLDGCEAMARSGGRPGEPPGPVIDLWMSFIATPTPATWYRAHNASIVSAYLDHRDLAERESLPERFFLNVALLRVLYAHALVAAPRLAAGWFAPLGRVLGDPRLGMAGGFESLPAPRRPDGLPGRRASPGADAGLRRDRAPAASHLRVVGPGAQPARAVRADSGRQPRLRLVVR
jgi:hypothetical protein